MRTAEQQTNNAHIAYLDRLRVLAAFAVVVLHLAAQGWYSADIFSTDWMVCNLYDSAVRWAVPVFVMISGAVFLNREIPVKRIFTKYIPRLITAYLFWSFVYAVYHGGDRETILLKLFAGSFHMWYVPMLAGDFGSGLLEDYVPLAELS